MMKVHEMMQGILYNILLICRPVSEIGLMKDVISLLYALRQCIATWKRENVWCINFTSREWNW